MRAFSYRNDENEREEPFKSTPPPTLVSAAEMMNSIPETPPTVWGPIIQTGGSLAIVGEAKSAKTYLALQLAMHVAEGTEFLGYETRRTGVLYINYEVPRREFSERMIDIQDADNIAEVNRLVVVNRPIGMYLDEKAGITDFQVTLEKANKTTGGCGLVILDPRSQSMSGNENSAGDLSFWIDNIRSVVNRFDTALVVVHHRGKNEHQTFGGRGSSAFDGAIESFLNISDDQNKIQIVSRHMEETEHDVEFLFPVWSISDREIVERFSKVERCAKDIIIVLENLDDSLPLAALRRTVMRKDHTKWSFNKALDKLKEKRVVQLGKDLTRGGNNKLITLSKLDERG